MYICYKLQNCTEKYLNTITHMLFAVVLVIKSFVSPLTVACQTDSSVHGTSQARILGRLPFPSSGDLPDPGIKPTSHALAGRFFTTEPPRKPHIPRCRMQTLYITKISISPMFLWVVWTDFINSGSFFPLQDPFTWLKWGWTSNLSFLETISIKQTRSPWFQLLHLWPQLTDSEISI